LSRFFFLNPPSPVSFECSLCFRVPLPSKTDPVGGTFPYSFSFLFGPFHASSPQDVSAEDPHEEAVFLRPEPSPQCPPPVFFFFHHVVSPVTPFQRVAIDFCPPPSRSSPPAAPCRTAPPESGPPPIWAGLLPPFYLVRPIFSDFLAHPPLLFRQLCGLRTSALKALTPLHILRTPPESLFSLSTAPSFAPVSPFFLRQV